MGNKNRTHYCWIGFIWSCSCIRAQDLFKNLISGILVLVEKRFKVGDWILVEEIIEGIVEKMDLDQQQLESLINQSQ